MDNLKYDLAERQIENSWADFPPVDPLQPTYGGGAFDGFLARLSADGATLVLASPLGGGDLDRALAVAVDPLGNIYVAGSTASTDFLTVNALQPGNEGRTDAFLLKIADPACVLPSDVGNTLRAARRAPGLIVLQWTDVGSALEYLAYEATAKAGPFNVVLGSAPSGLPPGLVVPAPPEARVFLRVAGSNSCGEGSH